MGKTEDSCLAHQVSLVWLELCPRRPLRLTFFPVLTATSLSVVLDTMSSGLLVDPQLLDFGPLPGLFILGSLLGVPLEQSPLKTTPRPLPQTAHI